MKKFLSVIYILLVCSVVFCEDIPITILHTNDIHGQHHSIDYAVKDLKLENVCGSARRGTLINKIRKENKHRTFLFDIGDISGGGEYKQYFGKPEIEIMNYLKYDLMTLGNHEFKLSDNKDNNLSLLNERVKEAKFPCLCANVYDLNNKRLFKPYVIFKEKGVRIAVVGMVCPKVKTYGLPVKYADPNEEFRKVIMELTGKYDILVFASHVGDLYDLALGKNYPEIDLIIEGDFHSFLFEPNKISKTPEFSDEIDYIPFCQTGVKGVYLGQIDLIIGKSKNKYYIKSFNSKLIPVTDDYKDNIFINNILEKYN